jgi:hypothetical protein
MNVRPSIYYPHRANQDGSFTSICIRCLAPVARAGTEAELWAHDNVHECNPLTLSERRFVEPPHLHSDKSSTQWAPKPPSSTKDGESGVPIVEVHRQ